MTCEVCAHADRHGCWPASHRGTHCRGCHRSWTGLAEAHCTVCHEHFTRDSSATTHRTRDGRCVPPADVLRKDLRPVLAPQERASGVVWGFAGEGHPFAREAS